MENFCKEKPFKRGFKKVIDKLDLSALYDIKAAYYINDLYANYLITKKEYFILMYILLYLNCNSYYKFEERFKKMIFDTFSEKKLKPNDILNADDKYTSFFKYFSECMVTFYKIENINDFKNRIYKLHAIMSRDYYDYDKNIEIHSIKGLFEILSRIKK